MRKCALRCALEDVVGWFLVGFWLVFGWLVGWLVGWLFVDMSYTLVSPSGSTTFFEDAISLFTFKVFDARGTLTSGYKLLIEGLPSSSEYFFSTSIDYDDPDPNVLVR